MRKYFIHSVVVALALTPALASAQNITDAWSLGIFVIKVIGRTMQLLWTLAIMSFLWGLVKFIQNSEDPAARKAGKQFMINSVIAFSVAVAFWALVNFVIQSSTISPDTGGYPTVDSSGRSI